MKAKTTEKDLLISKINSMIWYLADGAPARSFADINSAYEMLKIELMIYSRTENNSLILEKTNALPALSPMDFNHRNSLSTNVQFSSGLLANISSALQSILAVVENHELENIYYKA